MQKEHRYLSVLNTYNPSLFDAVNRIFTHEMRLINARYDLDILIMLKKIQAHLRKNPGLKAKTIATQLNENRKKVNKALHEHEQLFVQDDEFKWSLVPQDELRIELGDHSWLTARDFENALLARGSPLDSACRAVTFVVAKDCRILLEALARLLAICNQLAAAGKLVSVDFSDCRQTLKYLDRIGFFNHLSDTIEVLPRRPIASKAATYEGNNDGVVELRAIDPLEPNQNIPELLRHSFVSCAGDYYSVAAFTVLSELFSNVQEHSAATTVGFAGLQFYKRGNHIQTVISDSGRGIVGTLAPVLKEQYPEVAKKIEDSTLDSGVTLLREVFSGGGISRFKEDGRGLGLKRSGDLAQKFKATISVRQEMFELKVHHSLRGTRFSHELNLVRIAGTHICFDFELDQSAYSG